MKKILVHYELFIFDLSKMFKTMSIHFNFLKVLNQKKKYVFWSLIYKILVRILIRFFI